MAVWKCPDCRMRINRNPDDPISEAWAEGVIAEHDTVHAKQLAEHRGDREALRLRLRNPALAHAIAKATEIGGGADG